MEIYELVFRDDKGDFMNKGYYRTKRLARLKMEQYEGSKLITVRMNTLRVTVSEEGLI